MKYLTMEAGVKSDQGYESYDSMSACGSERKSSMSDAEFDPISDDDEEDDYSKPGLDASVIDGLSEQLRDGVTLLSRAPMKNIDAARDMRRDNAQPWSVQTQNSVTPSGGRVIRSDDKNSSYLLQNIINYERMYNGQQTQNVLTGSLHAQNVLTSNLQTQSTVSHSLQSQNVMTRNLQPQNVMTSTRQRNELNIASKPPASNNFASNNFISKNLTANNNLASNNFISNSLTTNNNLASLNFLSKNLTNNNDLYTSSGVGKNLPSYEVASKHLATTTNVPANNLGPVDIYVQPPSASSDELTDDDLPDLSEYPELQEFDFTVYIRHLFPDTLPELPELSAADVNEGFGQLDKNDVGKISPLSFSSTIIPPSVDSYPSSPTDCDLLAALSDQDALGAAINVTASQGNESVVPDFISILRPSDCNRSSLNNSSGNLPTGTATTNASLVSSLAAYSASTTDYSTYTSSTSSFLDIRDQRASFSTSSTPSHPGSVEYSPQSSAESQPSPHSVGDLELYQQFSPNIIPVTVNDDLGEEDSSSRSRASSRLDNTSAKGRLVQRIRADEALKKAKDAAWLAASITDPDKLIIAIQDLCGAVDPSVEAKFYANMEVFIDNATREQIVQLFESVSFQRCANVVNNPLLSAYVCEIMLDRGLE